MDLEDLKERARQVKAHNLELQLKQAHRPWSTAETTLGFVSDVGDLAKLVMMKSGLRQPNDDLDRMIGHELGDCLWSILTLADELGVDLESAFLETLNEILERTE